MPRMRHRLSYLRPPTPRPLFGGLILGDYSTMKPNDWWLVLAAVLVVILIYVLYPHLKSTDAPWTKRRGADALTMPFADVDGFTDAFFLFAATH